MRHLTHPEERVYFASMEEALYEVDVDTLEVRELWRDEQLEGGRHADLPGYDGKGLYSGQGRLVYANNGEHGAEAQRRPDVPSGVLAEWDGEAPAWSVVRRDQLTEVTGPGGILGDARPETDPLWSIGWDHRSLILACLDGGEWHHYRLPKASHAYDGAHGWNTEWPRIRDVGEDDLLMTMHGMFWRFPRRFTPRSSAGIVPRSTYLKVIGDFCAWQGRLVFGCDDSARAEFLNQRRAKGELAGPGQSQSNLWFLEPEALDHLGPARGQGALWLEEDVAAGAPSDPFLFQGFARRGLHLAHDTQEAVTFRVEVDLRGDGQWQDQSALEVPAHGYGWLGWDSRFRGAWIRLVCDRDATRVTALFHGSNVDRRGSAPAPLFAGLASVDDERYSGGLLRARGANLGTLHFAAQTVEAGEMREAGYYELDLDMRLRRVEDPAAHAWLKQHAAVPRGVLQVDAASVLYVDDDGRRYRLPLGDPAFEESSPIPLRVDREVCTERDLFQAHGTFYELPARNAGGFAKVRPIATSRSRITDYCSWRGLLVLSGVAADAPRDNRHILRSDDDQVALWVGAVDDLWQLGKAVGRGGPWLDTPVRAGEPSDPYLMSGYERKELELSHASDERITMDVEVDVTGAGLWLHYDSFEVAPGATVEYLFPPHGFDAYWVRLSADRDCRATAILTYR